MTEVEATCYFCPNECILILSVDDQGFVRKVRRKKTGARLPSSQDRITHCGNVAKLRGLHLEKVKAILRSPRVPRVVVGGH